MHVKGTGKCFLLFLFDRLKNLIYFSMKTTFFTHSGGPLNWEDATDASVEGTVYVIGIVSWGQG